MVTSLGRHARSAARTAIALWIAVVLAACAPTRNGYFDFGGGTGIASSAVPGELMYIGLVPLPIADGDRITLDSVELRGSGLPFQVDYLAAAEAEATDGAIGIVSDDELTASDRRAYRPLKGSTFESGQGTVLILVRLSMPANDVVIETISVRFRLNDGQLRSEAVPQAVRLCVSPAPASGCSAPRAPSV